MRPDVVVIRGAPGVGKSETARRLAERLGVGARVEVDNLRAMIVPVNWTDQSQHIGVLSLAVGITAGFLELGHRPVLVVDTFSGDKVVRFLSELRERCGQVDVRVFALVADASTLEERVRRRPEGQFKDVPVCLKLNADVTRRIQPFEQLIDSTALAPAAVMEALLSRIQLT